MSNALLTELNTFRAAENLAPFADWRKARHLPMLEAYRAAAAVETEDTALESEMLAAIEDAGNAEDETTEGDEPDALIFNTETGETIRESELSDEDAAKLPGAKSATEEVAKASETVKLPTYKQLPRFDKSGVAKPVNFVHEFLTEHPGLSRKEAVATLVKDHGVNYSTARTQYQRWYAKNKKGA